LFDKARERQSTRLCVSHQEGAMPRGVTKKKLRDESAIAPVEMPGLDSHLCFALYAASNHMTRLFAPFLEKLGVT